MAYQSTLAVQGRLWRRNQNITRHSNVSKKLGPISNILVVAILLCVLGLIYLTQITKTSSYGYQISELNEKKDELVEANQSLKVESAKLQALERIRNSEVASKLQDASQPTFVQP